MRKLLIKDNDLLVALSKNVKPIFVNIFCRFDRQNREFDTAIDGNLRKFTSICTLFCTFLEKTSKKYIQLISYERYLECTLVQWRLSTYLSLVYTGSSGYLFHEIPCSIIFINHSNYKKLKLRILNSSFLQSRVTLHIFYFLMHEIILF